MCVSYHIINSVPAKIVKVFHTYDPCMDLNDGRAFSDFYKCIVQNKDIVLHSNGSAIRTFCYATDAVIASFKILLDGECAEAYNVGNPHEEVSIKDWAQVIVDMYPEKNIKVVYDINDDDMTYGKMKSPILKTVLR